MSRKTLDVELIALTADVTADDSDKSFTVPAGVTWELLNLYATLVSTATAGLRRMVVEVQDGSSNVLARVQAGATQTISLTWQYNFAPGLADQTAVVNLTLNTALPKLVLMPGHVLRVYDITAVDAAADDLTVRFVAAVRPAFTALA